MQYFVLRGGCARAGTRTRHGRGRARPRSGRRPPGTAACCASPALVPLPLPARTAEAHLEAVERVHGRDPAVAPELAVGDDVDARVDLERDGIEHRGVLDYPELALAHVAGADPTMRVTHLGRTQQAPDDLGPRAVGARRCHDAPAASRALASSRNRRYSLPSATARHLLGVGRLVADARGSGRGSRRPCSSGARDRRPRPRRRRRRPSGARCAGVPVSTTSPGSRVMCRHRSANR